MGFNWRNLNQRSWTACKEDKRILSWIVNAKNATDQKLKVGAFDQSQLRCGGTWFVGANFLENDAFGKLNGISRAEIKSLIEENSGITVSSVSKKLNYLIVGEKPTKRKV